MHIPAIEQLLNSLLQEDMFLVAIKIKPVNNIKIFIDADTGLGIEKCIKINRALYKKIEETAIFPDGNFSLEISSPGVGEPLHLLRQYQKNIDRHVEVITNDGTRAEGKLTAANAEGITIEQTEGKGKKTTVKINQVGFNDIRETRVQIKF